MEIKGPIVVWLHWLIGRYTESTCINLHASSWPPAGNSRLASYYDRMYIFCILAVDGDRYCLSADCPFETPPRNYRVVVGPTKTGSRKELPLTD